MSEAQSTQVPAPENLTEAEARTTLHILLVENDPADADLMVHELRKNGFEVCTRVVQTKEEFQQRVKEKGPDIVLADYNLDDWRGIEALEILQREGLDIPVIIVSGAVGDVTAVECIKQGATDYVLKESLARLPESVRRALREKRLREEKKVAEENLAKKALELARSNAELEQFAYVASHDLQEPLRMVASYCELLGERYHGKLDDKADKYIGYAVDGARRMQVLIRDLLQYSRVGTQAKPLQPTDADAVLTSVLQGLQRSVQDTHAVIVRETLPAVQSDEVQLAQVFQNVIGNALKFHGKEAPQIQVSAKVVEEMVRFTVSDNGIGIEAESSDRIFKMFQRLHTREEYDGSGIGLAIAKKIIERHCGQIWFESVPAQGTTFYFTLRAAPTKKHEEVESDRAYSSAAGGG